MTNLRHDIASSGEMPVGLIGNGQESDERRGFDSDGVPEKTPVSDWLDLEPPLDSRWLQSVLRFSRPDGSIVFGKPGRSRDRLKRLDAWASKLGDPSLASVIARWLPSSRSSAGHSTPPPLPADSRPDRVLAILRADWTPRGDLVAVDHRQTGFETTLEVGSKGQVWLGPTWTSTFPTGRSTQPRPTHWINAPFAQSLEWSFSVGQTRVTRVLTLLRGRSMALLGQQVEGKEITSEIRLTLASGVEASFVPGSRALVLKSSPGKPPARILPLGLPCHDRPTDQGSIAVEGREVVIRQNFKGRRNWLPALICWDKPPKLWRPLTVAYRSKATKSDQAIAVRVAWGVRDAGLVIYRSLDPAELRSFLGYQTASRYLVGSFTRSGDVVPILKVDG